jgi:hypothetical protein
VRTVGSPVRELPVLRCFLIVLCFVVPATTPAHAQSITWPQLSGLTSSPIYQSRPGTEEDLQFSRKSPDTLLRQIKPTHWKEGGLVGALLVGALGAWFGNEICRNDEVEDDCTGLILRGGVGGGAAGFLLGALVGGQFPKHVEQQSADSS